MTTDASATLTLGSIPARAPEDSRSVERSRPKAADAEFERHVREHRSDLYGFAFWFTRDPFVAEDALQEALLRGWRSWESLQDKSAVKQWLLTIVRRECARMYERKRPAATSIDELPAAEAHLIATNDDPHVHDLQRAILQLDAMYREPLVLQVLMGYSTEEIAQIIGIKRGAVLTRLFRARRKLAAQIGEPV